MNRLLFALVWSSALFMAADCASVFRSYRKKAEKSYAEGMENFNRGEFREALKHFEYLASLDPEYNNADRTRQYIENIIAGKIEQNYQAGLQLERNRNPVGAILAFREAIRWNDGDSYKDAEKHIDSLLKEEPVKATVKIYNDRGVNFEKAKQPGMARLQYIETLRLDPDDGLAGSAKKRVDKELFEAADTAFRAGKEMLKAYNYLGATNKFREAVTLFPEHSEAQKALQEVSTLIANENRYQAGVAALNQGNPIDALAQFSAIIGPHRDSAAQYQRAIDQIKANMDTHFRNAVTMYEAQRLKEALYLLRLLLVADPAHDQARKYLDLSQKKLDTLEKLGTD